MSTRTRPRRVVSALVVKGHESYSTAHVRPVVFRGDAEGWHYAGRTFATCGEVFEHARKLARRRQREASRKFYALPYEERCGRSLGLALGEVVEIMWCPGTRAQRDAVRTFLGLR